MASQDHHHGDHSHSHDDHHDHHHSHGDAAGKGSGSWVGEDGRVYHSHDGLAPHSHEPIYSAGDFTKRAPPLDSRRFDDRAFTVGIGGPVGTGYEAAVEQLTDATMALDMGAYNESQALVAAGQAEVKLCQRGCQAVPEHRNILMARNTEVDRLCSIALAIAKLIRWKTALMLALCTSLRDKYSLAAVTNDIFTKEDGEFLVKHGALPEERIRAVETGGCPHAAIREDISINLGPLEELSNLYKADLLLCESGGDNLAANFSRELADYIIYIIDVSGGDKIPRKGGPGITQADLLVINKTDLAAAVGADLSVMERDALRMREGGPFVFAQVKHGVGVEEIVGHVLRAWEIATGNRRR